MIKNSNISTQNSSASLLPVQPQVKVKNNAVLLTAITLLPELIAIIKIRYQVSDYLIHMQFDLDLMIEEYYKDVPLFFELD